MNLEQDGIERLGKLLRTSEIREIVDYFDVTPCFAASNYRRALESKAQPQSANAIRQSSYFGVFSFADIVNAPHLLELANREDVVEKAEAYLGGKVVLYAMSVWLSFPQTEAAAIGQRMHRDPSDERCTFFCYLTDVDQMTGPHVYIRGSHHEKEFRDLVGAEISKLTYDHDGYQSPLDSIIPPLVPHKVETITGESGTCFIEDSHGLHRGTCPITRHRLMFSARYTLNVTNELKRAGWTPQPLQNHSRLGIDAKRRSRFLVDIN